MISNNNKEYDKHDGEDTKIDEEKGYEEYISVILIFFIASLFLMLDRS